MFNVRYDLGQVTRRFKKLREGLERGEILKRASAFVVEQTAAYIFRRSLTRHKVANKYGVDPTGILEFVPRSPSSSKGGGKIYARGNGGRQSLFISGVPFIQKAFRALHIVPKQKQFLTIPISRFSVHKRVRDLRASGWCVFRPKGKHILMGRKTKRVFVLYALVKSVKIPRDAKLLPASYLMDMWTQKSIKQDLAKV